MELKLWGVRGSTPTPQIENLAYGGNTPCIEVSSEDSQILIFDGGSGVRNVGQALVRQFPNQKLLINFFLTHYHWDHIQGIPFFLPIYHPGHEVVFHAPAALGPLQERLQGQMSKPYFPVTLEAIGQHRFVELDSPEMRFGSLRVCPFPLNHPQGAFAYRIESESRAIVYATDTEHGHPQLDTLLRDRAQGADVLIYDSQYTPEEYERHRGWGHSTWLEAANVARDAGIGQLILFHHDPWHSDQQLLEIVRQARRKFENTLVAAEGWVVHL